VVKQRAQAAYFSDSSLLALQDILPYLLEKWPCSGVSLAGRHQLVVIDRMSR
jgi:hypothetical protein